MADLEHWEKFWIEGPLSWHKEDVDQMLTKYYEYVGKSVFVPLCGKSLDMKWLASEGHCVVGCDIIELAAQQFFIENNIPYKKFTTDHFTVYESIDDSLMIKLLVGDVFNCTTNNTYDTIWDCNALVALNPEDRDKYITTLHSLLKPNGNMLLSSYEYDPTFMKTKPPASLLHDDLKSLFGPHSLEVIYLDTEKSVKLATAFALPWANRNMFNIKEKV